MRLLIMFAARRDFTRVHIDWYKDPEQQEKMKTKFDFEKCYGFDCEQFHQDWQGQVQMSMKTEAWKNFEMPKDTFKYF